MSNWTFVVLHYCVPEATIRCVGSIETLYRDACNVSVVVVDNCSPDGSSDSIRAFCDASEHRFYLKTEKNLGFAGGNNRGFCFAKEKLNPDYVVCSNNDVIFADSGFVACVEERARAGVDVFGPDVRAFQSGVHQSPFPLCRASVRELRRAARVRRGLASLLERSPLFRVLLSSYFSVYDKASSSQISSEGWQSARFGATLQGSCIVFSGRYLREMDWAFYPGTFMYLEEDILHFIVEQKGMKILYDPATYVLHDHSLSTNTSKNNRVRKQQFIWRALAQSYDAFADVVEGNGRGSFGGTQKGEGSMYT